MEQKLECLFVTASTTACGGEVKLIRDTMNNLGMGLREVEWISDRDFQTQITKGEKYHVIYLGAHADHYGFGEAEGRSLTSWEQLATAICQSNCISPGGTLFLGCCRGGMKTVALKILKLCDRIDYICGPNWKVTGNDITTAFQAFVRSRVSKNEEPAKAAERASEAAGFRFTCYDRQELQSEIETLRQIQNIEFTLSFLQTQQSWLLQEMEKVSQTVSALADKLLPSTSTTIQSSQQLASDIPPKETPHVT